MREPLRLRAPMFWLGLLLVFGLEWLEMSHAHDDGAPAVPCKSDRGVTVKAAFRPGIITLDGDSKDWADVKGYQFPLLPALNPDPSEKFPMNPGRIQVKAVHDGRDIFFNLEFSGDYTFTDGVSESCPSVALMFGVGDDATYHNMGGCRQNPNNCSRASCHGYDVDIMHFEVSTAVPGRLYGSNLLDNLNGTGADRFGGLNDLYAWNPHCQFLDGDAPNGMEKSVGQNDWRGTWTHTSISLDYGLVQGDSPYGTEGKNGFYIFEFSRPLRTSDRLQQDVQFTVGGSFPFAAAVWYPVDHVPWRPSQHYSANCAWIPLKILLPASSNSRLSSKVVATISIFSLFVASIALGTALLVGWWVKLGSPRAVGFQGLPNL